MMTTPGGFVQRNAYFSSAELTDPAFERRFRFNHPVGCANGETFVRREIRWYEPTLQDGERCAAVIHLAVCKGQRLERLTTERVRAELIALEPEKVIPRHCGPDQSVSRKEDNLFGREKQQIVLTAFEEGCHIADLNPHELLEVFPNTRFGVKTIIDATLVPEKNIVADTDFLRRAPEMILSPAAYAAGERQPQFMQSGVVVQQGTNIGLKQRVARSGQGYCISLTAVQGGRVWRRGFDRPSGLSPIAAQKGWQSPPPLLRDAHALARALRASLKTKPFSLLDR